MPSKRWRAAVRGRRHKRRRARRRRRARGGSAPEVDDADFITAILRALTTNVARPKPPVDPYARGSVVPPMKTAQKVSAEHAEYNMGKSAWGNRPFDPERGAYTGLVRTTVPIWGGGVEAQWVPRNPI